METPIEKLYRWHLETAERLDRVEKAKAEFPHYPQSYHDNAQTSINYLKHRLVDIEAGITELTMNIRPLTSVAATDACTTMPAWGYSGT